MPSPKYPDSLINAFHEIHAWRLACVALAALGAFLASALVWESHNATVVLVPAGFAESQGKITVEPNSHAGVSPDYLSQVALGDLSLILDWQPLNVAKQYQRFLNRTTTELYARENVRLLAEADQHQKDSESQSFYPADVQVNVKQAQAIITGTLVRWVGDKEVTRTQIKYAVTYSSQKGFLHVANVEISK